MTRRLHLYTPFLRPTSSKQAWRAARTFPLDDYAYSSLDAGASPGVPIEARA